MWQYQPPWKERRRELAKAMKKSIEEQHVALCAYFVYPGKSSSYMEWIMDSTASNHMIGIASLFSSYDIINTQHKSFN